MPQTSVKPRGEQRVDGAQQQAADNHLNEDEGHRTLFFGSAKGWGMRHGSQRERAGY
jgi:hypothetical protein